jgi:hypothetical protein
MNTMESKEEDWRKKRGALSRTHIHMQAQSGLYYWCVTLLSSFAGVKALQVQNILTGIEVVH